MLPLACLPCCLIIDAWAFVVAALVLVVVALGAAGARPARRGGGGGHRALGLFALVKVTLLIAALVVAVPLPPPGCPCGDVALESAGGGADDRGRLARLRPAARWRAGLALPLGPLGDLRRIPQAMQMWPHPLARPAGLAHRRAARCRGAVPVVGAAATTRPDRGSRRLGALLLLAFKAGFVRAIDHLFVTTATYQAVGLVLAAGLWPRRWRAAAIACVAAPLLLTVHGLERESASSLLGPLQRRHRQSQGPVDTWDAWMMRRCTPVRRPRRPRALRNPLPPLIGRGDIYPHDAGVILACGETFRDPRPVFQSYMAYTSALAEQNWVPSSPALTRRTGCCSASLRSTAATRASTTAPPGPRYLSRYELASVTGRYLQLARRAQPTPWRLVPLGAHRAVVESTQLDVPSNAARPCGPPSTSTIAPPCAC